MAIVSTVTVKNRAGIHARPASMIVKAANKFRADVFFEKGSLRVNGKSIMGIITLGAGHKARLRVVIEGDDEQEAMKAIVDLFETRFAEGDD